jgi:hypothetical protein
MRKNGINRMATLAWRSVAGEVGGHVSVHILSHPIPVARTRLKPMTNAHSARSSIAPRVEPAIPDRHAALSNRRPGSSYTATMTKKRRVASNLH